VIKLFGLGLSSAVLLDAVVIRTVLVPAIMQLFGKSAWWFPDWLGKILPRLHVEPGEPQLADQLHPAMADEVE
jgi:RND superfamily putative drug exporter